MVVEASNTSWPTQLLDADRFPAFCRFEEYVGQLSAVAASAAAMLMAKRNDEKAIDALKESQPKIQEVESLMHH